MHALNFHLCLQEFAAQIGGRALGLADSPTIFFICCGLILLAGVVLTFSAAIRTHRAEGKARTLEAVNNRQRDEILLLRRKLFESAHPQEPQAKDRCLLESLPTAES